MCAFSIQAGVLNKVTEKGLLDVGTCGLHHLHNSFRSGFEVINWDIAGLTKSFYGLLKDSLARRDDYIALTGIGKFPLKFYSHRWVENVVVAERTVEILPAMTAFVKRVQADCCSTAFF